MRFSIDRGGTFTDIYAEHEGRIYVRKLLSVDPDHYDDAPAEGIARLLQECDGISRSAEGIDPSRIGWIRMGTTVATNALLERRGAKTALLVTEGFEDLLTIGDQSRDDLFALEIAPRPQLQETTAGIKERVVFRDGIFHVEHPLDEADARQKLRRLRVEGFEAVAISLMHAYGFEAHERRLGELAREAGFDQVSLSCEVMNATGYLARTRSAAVDAYLTPEVRRYVARFRAAFASSEAPPPVDFMQSFGGLCEAEAFRGINAVLSGPAGGVTALASLYGGRPLIGFDMGGTSTDVCRYDGTYEVGYEQRVAGIAYRAPQLQIETVAAGGGSRLFFERGMFRVGPESAGAHPGPVCYKKGGPLAVTDANLLLGRLQSDFFPAVFGEKGDEPPGLAETVAAFEALAETINAGREKPMDIHTIAESYLRVANDAMASAIKTVSTRRGFAPDAHTLVPFGGAGAQHACAVARLLGMHEVLIHRDAGVFSAYGLSRATRVQRFERSVGRPLSDFDAGAIEGLFAALCEGSACTKTLQLRYEGSEARFDIDDLHDPLAQLEAEHRRLFGFAGEGGVILEAVVAEKRERLEAVARPRIAPRESPLEAAARRRVFFDGRWHETPFYKEEALRSEDRIAGPAVIVAPTSTVVIEPGCDARVDAYGDLYLRVGGAETAHPTTVSEPQWLPIFANLFASVAEQMGYVLQRTAKSTNIRERLDFSCAVFDAAGSLVANAPHIPVHLGAMSETVRMMLARFGDTAAPGDVFVSNAPFEGGSHLPDITVITPHFEEGRIRYLVASRGHHADIGGKTPGSMPPDSVTLEEEGTLITLRRAVVRGTFDEAGLRTLFERGGARNIDENLADLRAQIAANRQGIALLESAAARYGSDVLCAYMGHLQRVSAEAVRTLLRELAKKRGERLHACDGLDDGSVIDLRLQLDAQRAEAVFDFTRSADTHPQNQNAPAAVTYSAVIYALRTLTGEALPLNGGFLSPVRIRLRRGSILDPKEDAAVVGGNVTTSQRIVDVIFQAFGAAADSCGCMNNLTFGDGNFGYYETVAGGAGATAAADGASAVHTHMTNTRITDPEVLERRYPVVLERFALRRGSGGAGARCGGEGLIRRLRFEAPVRLSLLTERRRTAPHGIEGGEPGAAGENLLIRGDEVVTLDGKASVEIEAGDVLEMRTPGGGGYGNP